MSDWLGWTTSEYNQNPKIHKEQKPQETTTAETGREKPVNRTLIKLDSGAHQLVKAGKEKKMRKQETELNTNRKKRIGLESFPSRSFDQSHHSWWLWVWEFHLGVLYIPDIYLPYFFFSVVV